MLANHQPNKPTQANESIPQGHMLLNLQTKLKHEKQTTRTRPRVKEGKIIQNRT
jgi:hypothetical protein